MDLPTFFGFVCINIYCIYIRSSSSTNNISSGYSQIDHILEEKGRTFFFEDRVWNLRRETLSWGICCCLFLFYQAVVVVVVGGEMGRCFTLIIRSRPTHFLLVEPFFLKRPFFIFFFAGLTRTVYSSRDRNQRNKRRQQRTKKSLVLSLWKSEKDKKGTEKI